MYICIYPLPLRSLGQLHCRDTTRHDTIRRDGEMEEGKMNNEGDEKRTTSYTTKTGEINPHFARKTSILCSVWSSPCSDVDPGIYLAGFRGTCDRTDFGIIFVPREYCYCRVCE